jgi:aminotransferase
MIYLLCRRRKKQAMKRRRQMSRVSQIIETMPPSGIRRFFDIVSTMDGVLSLGIGEPDFVTPERIRNACVSSLAQGQTMYTSNHGLLELRQVISGHISRVHGVEYNPEKEILITVGVSEALDITLRAILNPGDEVIVFEPSYVSYKPCVVMAGGVAVAVEARSADGFRVTADIIEHAVTEKTKAILLCYPNNPTGMSLSAEELERIAALAVKHDLIIISDEIYEKLTYDMSHLSIASLPGMKERVITLNGFSKAYAMTGWRLGYIAGPVDILNAAVKIHQYVALCAPIMSQTAAIEALKNEGPEVEEMVSEYNRRRHLIHRGLNEIGLEVPMPDGAFYIFPSIKRTGLTSEEFAERLLFEEKVAVVPGTAFGACGEGYVRCSYSISYERIEEALARIEKFVRSRE